MWGVILLQAFGGLNVAFILKHADNILKGFAAAFSTVVSCRRGRLLRLQADGPFLVGALLINVAAYGNAPPNKGPGSGVLQRMLFGKPRLKQDEDENNPWTSRRRRGGEGRWRNSSAPRRCDGLCEGDNFRNSVEAAGVSTN